MSVILHVTDLNIAEHTDRLTNKETDCGHPASFEGPLTSPKHIGPRASTHRLVNTWLVFKPGSLKAVDTIGNCQTPVFLLGVSQHMHKITNL